MLKFAWLACLCCFAAASVAAVQPPVKLADKLTGDWKVKVSPSGTDANQPGVKEFDETLTFDGSKMSAKVMGDKGFKAAAYNEDVSAYGPAKFDCKQDSDKEGHLGWQGEMDADQLKGTLVWTNKDGKDIHYDFEGSKSGQ